MRNLKKFLALALAVVMTMSVMSIASAKTYSDSSTVADKYVEAVDVLSGLKVFEGDDTGAFNPKANITRAEVAAIIYRAATGDVDTDNYKIYADYNKFTDVPSTKWYAGYVNYCANAVYIRGVGNGKFNPNGNVTGYEALAMILRAVGYDQANEWTGDEWTQKVASTAKQLGITDTVDETTLGQAATREVVAELLFRTIANVPTVTYSSTFGYNQYTAFNGTTKNPTLGEKNFSLVKIDGVITANEWASLTDDEPIAADTTAIDGVVYNGLSTDLTDLGESIKGWAYGAKKTVIYSADSGLNTVAQTGEATNNIAKFAKDNGISSITGAEHFFNFDKVYNYRNRAEILITYSTDGTAANKVAIKVGDAITSADITAIQNIFMDQEYAQGWVLVGTTYSNTQTDNQANDLSNSMKYSEFAEKYLTNGSSSTSLVTSTVNGDWLKIIDNDGDGVADYVLKTEFVLDQVEAYNTKTEEVTLYNDGTSLNLASVAGGSYTYSYQNDYTPVVGDVVLYTVIDGVCYMDLADTEVATVQTYSYKNDTITTTDGDTYGQSNIDNETGYQETLKEISEKVAYNLYFDAFGYVRAYDEVAGSTNYALITETYTTNSNNTAVIKNTTGIAEVTIADAKTAEYVVTNYSTVAGNAFFGTASASGNKLVTAIDGLDVYTGTSFVDNTTHDGAATNIAAYTLSDDGIALNTAAKQATNKAGKLLYNTKDGTTVTTTTTPNSNPAMAVDYVELDLSAGVAAKATQYPVGETNNNATNNTIVSNNRYVNATLSTEYYIVLVDTATGNATKVDKYFVGRNNVTAIPAGNINAAYAVATNTNADKNKDAYWVADVIVIELNAAVVADYDSVSLAYFYESKTTGEVQNINTLNNQDGLENIVPAKKTWNNSFNALSFYEITDTDVDNVKGVDEITKDYNAHGIYADTILRVNKLNTKDDYIDLVNGGSIVIENVPAYKVVVGKNGVNTLEEITLSNADVNHNIIYVMNGKTIAYIVDVDCSDTAKGQNDQNVDTLYGKIDYEQTHSTPSTAITVSFEADAQSDLTTAQLKALLGTLNVTNGTSAAVDLSGAAGSKLAGYTVSITSAVDAEGNTVAHTAVGANTVFYGIGSDVTATLNVTANATNSITVNWSTNAASVTAVALDPSGTNTSMTSGTAVTNQKTGTYTVGITGNAGYTYQYSTDSGTTKTNITTTNGSGTFDVTVTDNTTIDLYQTAITLNVTKSTGTGYTVTGPDTATYGTAYTFAVTPAAGYSVTVSATVGGTAAGANLTDNNNGTWTITNTAVTGDIVISVTATEASYTITFSHSTTTLVAFNSSSVVIADNDTATITGTGTYNFKVTNVGDATKISVSGAKLTAPDGTTVTDGTSASADLTSLATGTYTISDATGAVSITFGK